MAVPYTFGTATAAIPLSQLDSNFNTAITIGNTAVQLGNTITTLSNVTLTNATITSLANVTLSNATISSLSTPITAAQGGTGLATLTSNNVVLGNGTGNVLLVAPGTSGNALVSNGTTWSSSAVSANVSSVTGILPVSNGGTGASSLTANNVLLGNGTSAVQIVAPGTTGNVLTSNGTTWTSTALGSSSAMTLISTQTANNTASTITFTGLSGYNKYILVTSELLCAARDEWIFFTFGYGATPTYITSGYYSIGTYCSSSDTTATFFKNANYAYASFGAQFKTISTGIGTNAFLNINNFINSPYNVTYTCQSYENDNVGASYLVYISQGGYVSMSSNPATAIKIYSYQGSNFTQGTVSLYGISS